MKNLLLLIAILLSVNISAQNPFLCGDQLIKAQLEKKYPGVSNIIENTFKSVKANSSERADILKIPVVFHVIYNTEEENLSESVIRSQLDVLNEDFRRMNDNASETRDIFQGLAADPEIEFFFAGEDPDGNPTSGITRTQTDKESFIDISFEQILAAISECGFDLEDPDVFACILELLGGAGGLDLDTMKSSLTGGKDAWETDRYLNIWVVNLSINAGGMPSPFILGFAYPPMEAPNWPEDTLPDDIQAKDGIVLHYQIVGRNNPQIGDLAGTNDKGRTAVHEVGHYLGLRHIWGDGDCIADDGLLDTPPAASNSQPTVDVSDCTDMHMKDSCADDMLPDMIENYMDYSLERCQNVFTSDQVNLMRSMLEGPRSGLLSNQISAIENTASQTPLIYPNPSSGQIYINGLKSDMLVRIYGRTGVLLLETNKESFSIQDKPGLYFIEIVSTTESYFSRIVLK